MAKWLNPRIGNDTLDFDTHIGVPEVSDNIQRTLAYLIGYNAQLERYDLAKLDEDGNLIVSTDGSVTQNFSPSRSTVTTSATLIVASRVGRKSLLIKNTGSNGVYVASVTTPTVATGYLIEPNSVLTLTNYSGQLYGITSVGSDVVQIGEMF